MLTGLQCSTAKAVRAPEEKAGRGDFEGWAAAAILTQRPAAERQTNHEVHAVLYTAAEVETNWCNNSTHWDVQPTIALSAVLCCRSSESRSDLSRHLTLLGPESRSVRQTNQAISRCCVVDRETLSRCFFFCSLGFSL